jgi:ketosteroid isomerase-like protein
VSSANLDLVRSIYADWERGDWSPTEWAHPEIEFVIPDGPEPTTVKGLVGMASVTRETLRTWEDVRIVADEFRELDGQRILVLARRTGRAKASGLEITDTMRTQGAWLFHLREAKVTRLVSYWDRDRALA